MPVDPISASLPQELVQRGDQRRGHALPPPRGVRPRVKDVPQAHRLPADVRLFEAGRHTADHLATVFGHQQVMLGEQGRAINKPPAVVDEWLRQPARAEAFQDHQRRVIVWPVVANMHGGLPPISSGQENPHQQESRPILIQFRSSGQCASGAHPLGRERCRRGALRFT